MSRLPRRSALALLGVAGCRAGDAFRGGWGPQSARPADVLDLANWKLTLPVGEPQHPREVKQPELARYEHPEHFFTAAWARGVVFRAHAGGVTTRGSRYPRSELREMVHHGVDRAAWSIASGSHTMTVTQAITHLPSVKPHLVAGQIHDGNDEVVMIRLEGRRLFVAGGGEQFGELDAAYRLGVPFTVRMQAAQGRIRVYYEDLQTPKVDVPHSAATCYFKAGAYTQSNLEKGDHPSAYGAVTIYALTVQHHES